MSANAIETLRDLLANEPEAGHDNKKDEDWCVDCGEWIAEYGAAVEALLEAAKDSAHSHPGVEWGYDAAGIHTYEAGEDPQGCPVCEALSRVETGQ